MSYTGYDPENVPVDAVRFLVGDTESPFQLSDTEIQFALDQANGSTYSAAAICARALSARYARQVDTKFETVESKYSQLRDNFNNLARQLDQQAKRQGAGLGLPVAGGMSKAEVDSVRSDTDRVPPFFYDNLFNNPPPPNE